MSERTAETQGVYNLDKVDEAAVNVLRNRRVQCGYDIEELANYADISEERLRDIEALEISVTAAELYILGKELGISIEVFFIMLVEED